MKVLHRPQERIIPHSEKKKEEEIRAYTYATVYLCIIWWKWSEKKHSSFFAPIHIWINRESTELSALVCDCIWPRDEYLVHRRRRRCRGGACENKVFYIICCRFVYREIRISFFSCRCRGCWREEEASSRTHTLSKHHSTRNQISTPCATNVCVSHTHNHRIEHRNPLKEMHADMNGCEVRTHTRAHKCNSFHLSIVQSAHTALTHTRILFDCLGVWCAARHLHQIRIPIIFFSRAHIHIQHAWERMGRHAMFTENGETAWKREK